VFLCVRDSDLPQWLLQLRVLRFRSDEDGNVRVGVLPECEEILISGLGFGGVALHDIGATELKVRKCSDGFVDIITNASTLVRRQSLTLQASMIFWLHGQLRPSNRAEVAAIVRLVRPPAAGKA
jgi:hypothetical protein